MEFTYDSYKGLISLIKENGYIFTDYVSYNKLGDKPCCILRHDIDNSIEKAYIFSKLESDMGISSTYFVLTTSDFYNYGSAKNVRLLKQIAGLGHNIGLHFDETAYSGASEASMIKYAEKERLRLQEVIDTEINSVSMHRPSKETLQAEWKFDNMINSYSASFFKEFKYLSDSRRNWREPVEDIVSSREYNRLHILTHPFWYNETEMSIRDSVKEFILHANVERYATMESNIKDLASIMTKEELGE